MASPIKVSKNQRSGKKQVHAPKLCAQGHALVSAKVVQPGRRGMRLLCECDGLAPGFVGVYAQIHDRFTGKSRLPQKDKGCVPQGSGPGGTRKW